MQNVRENGDSAVRAYTEKFDGRAPEQTEVSRKELEDCLQSCDPKFRQALQDAARNIRDFHERQKQQSWLTTRADGTVMGQRVRGLHRVGIYVPGGTAAYPSLRFNERHSRPCGRGGRDRHGHAPRQRRPAEPRPLWRRPQWPGWTGCS